MSNNPFDAQNLADYMVGSLALELKKSPDTIAKDESFLEFGLDSLKLVNLVQVLEEKLGVTIEMTEVLEHPSINELAAHLAEKITAQEEHND